MSIDPMAVVVGVVLGVVAFLALHEMSRPPR
jgi:hypothetical protein